MALPSDASPSKPSLHPGVVALCVVVVFLALVVVPRFSSSKHHLVGKAAPDFSLEVVHNGEPGAKVHLAELQGHPVLIDFWATWCGPCQLEAPVLSRVAEHYKDRGLVVLGVNTNDRPGLAAVFAQKKSLVYPILFDEQDTSANLYGVESLPTLFVIGKDGIVRAVHTGLVSEGALDSMLSNVL